MVRNAKNTEELPPTEADLDPKEAKRQKRLMRNRLSAQLHRERQRSYMEGLQRQVAALTAERDVLRTALDTLVSKATSMTALTSTELLEDIPLPLPAEELVGSSPPTARPTDGGDIMVELLQKARSQIIPRSKAAAASLLESTALRMSSGVASPTSTATASTRRASKRRASSVEDSSPGGWSPTDVSASVGRTPRDLDDLAPSKLSEVQDSHLKALLELDSLDPLLVEPSAKRAKTGSALDEPPKLEHMVSAFDDLFDTSDELLFREPPSVLHDDPLASIPEI